MKASVDQETCTGCELCTQVCPEVFSMADGKAVAQTQDVPAEAENNAKDAADQCPVAAIKIEE